MNLNQALNALSGNMTAAEGGDDAEDSDEGEAE
jgi:hypothetical protein